MNVTVMTSNHLRTRDEVFSGQVALTCLMGLLLGAYIRLLALEPSATFLQSLGLFDLNQTTLLKIGATTHLYYALSLVLGIFLVDWVPLPLLLFIAAMMGISGNLRFGTHETSVGLIHATALVSIANGLTLLCLLKIFSQIVPKKYLPVMFGLLFAAMAVSPALAANSFMPLLKHHHAWPIIDEIMSMIGVCLYTSLLLLLHFNRRIKTPSLGFSDILITYRKLNIWMCAAIGGLAAWVITSFISLWLTPIAQHYFHFTPSQASWMANLTFWGLITGILGSGIIAQNIEKRKTFFACCFLIATACISIIAYIQNLPISLFSSLCFLSGMSIGAVYLTYLFAREDLSLKQIGLGFGLIAFAFQFGNLKSVSFISELNDIYQAVQANHLPLQVALANWQTTLNSLLFALVFCTVFACLLPSDSPNHKVPPRSNHPIFHDVLQAWHGQYPLLSCLGFIGVFGTLLYALALFIGLSALSPQYTLQTHLHDFALMTEMNLVFRALLLPYLSFATICLWRCARSENLALRLAIRITLLLSAVTYLSHFWWV